MIKRIVDQATLRLFNGVLTYEQDIPHMHLVEQTVKRSVRNGYIIDPHIRATYELMDDIEDLVGISGEKANASFHKSWKVVRDASIETLIIQQVLHYITTYGFEFLGIYTDDTVYIPHEQLDIPGLTEHLPLTVIKAMTHFGVASAVVELAASGIALSEQTLEDIMVLVKEKVIDLSLTEVIENRELKALCQDYYGIVPTDPTEFLRYLVAKLTDESLVIKNTYLIEKIKESSGKFLDVLLEDAPEDLASIFFRYKPLFLAMKSISVTKKGFFNRLRKDADKMHRPLPPDYLNTVTDQIKRGVLDRDVLKKRLVGATIWRKIRLAYALQFRLDPGDSVVYQVRNGKGWVTGFQWGKGLKKTTRKALKTVVKSIAGDITEEVEGKTFYIPTGVHYALPATEKQFTGALPNGTYVAVPEDMIVGVHWTNTDRRIDLDLSVVSASGKIGWDARYRDNDRSVLFSGDVTDAQAPNGASELFYLREGQDEARLLVLNFYNFVEGDEVDAKILVAHEKPAVFGSNYMINQNNIVAQATVKVDVKEVILGVIVNVDGENRFYFSHTNVGGGITSRTNERSTQVREYMVQKLVGSLELKGVIEKAGGVVVQDRPEEGEYVDLSPSNLDKTTFIKLLAGLG